ncbi:MAG TPA: GNAT family N-acetyltransferase [Ruminococcus sp.]|nr:GNAT family N-acetyltransferase [Ruminococcus sp.]
MNYYEELKKMLSMDMNCKPADFDIEENVLTIPAFIEGRRIYSPEKHFFHMVSTGSNVIINADGCLDEALVAFLRRAKGFKLFEIPNLLTLEPELNKYGHTLSETYHMFLPVNKEVIPAGKFDVRWYFDEEIRRFYGDSRFPNAICPEFKPERPDRIVVCACKGREILGMAGCSEDTKGWQQIGIDVMPKYRSKGIGTFLVSILRNKIIENGDIPFYGTQIANIHSWNIAIKSGFRPAWIEVGANRI